jgi:hypothetical protein
VGNWNKCCNRRLFNYKLNCKNVGRFCSWHRLHKNVNHYVSLCHKSVINTEFEYIKAALRIHKTIRGLSCSSLQVFIPDLLRYTQIITWISVLILSFCTVHIQHSSPQ